VSQENVGANADVEGLKARSTSHSIANPIFKKLSGKLQRDFSFVKAFYDVSRYAAHLARRAPATKSK
jgi:hypothetical protein